MENLRAFVRQMVDRYFLPYSAQLKAGWYGLGILAVSILASQKIKASYGRHFTPSSFLPTVNGKAGWMIMEMISPATMVLVFNTFKSQGPVLSTGRILFLFWLAHYFNRSFYAVIRSPSVKQSRLDIVVFSAVFNAINAGWIGYDLADLNTQAFELSFKTLVGLALFVLGMVTNIRMDYQLQDARQKAGGQYILPDWGLYKYILSPNYASEIVEWTGFALLQGRESAWAFVFWTICNLAPRARSHLLWYKEKFGEKVADRTSIIPYVL